MITHVPDNVHLVAYHIFTNKYELVKAIKTILDIDKLVMR